MTNNSPMLFISISGDISKFGFLPFFNHTVLISHFCAHIISVLSLSPTIIEYFKRLPIDISIILYDIIISLARLLK